MKTNITTERLVNATVKELVNGYLQGEGTGFYTCLFCGRKFDVGVIFPAEGLFLTAERAVKRHVADEHGDVFQLLLSLGSAATGLTDVQESLMALIRAGKSDAQIAAELGGKSASTVRNHRFQMRKRKIAAKLYLALMELLEENETERVELMEYHGDLALSDDRIEVTKEEERSIVRRYFHEGEHLKLLSFPRKLKIKMVILNRITALFDKNRHYTEKEVNRILSPLFDDYVTLRRYLIDYGFLARKIDCSDYWRK